MTDNPWEAPRSESSESKGYSRLANFIKEHLIDSTAMVVTSTPVFAATSVPINLGLYTFAGETDPKKIAIGTGTGVLISSVLGPFVGYSIDALKDLTGFEKCERKTYPDFIRKQSSGVKKGIIAGVTAASLGLMALIYSTPDNVEPIEKEQVSVVSEVNSSPLENMIRTN